MNVWPGKPFPLGAMWDGEGTNFSLFRRCPGGQTQPAVDGSSPFLDAGNLTTPIPPFTNDCTVTDVPPGP